MKCPFCKETIDDDSHFCDQCGKELHFCPECHQPKRGTECPSCGADLVSAEAFFAKKEQSSTEAPKPMSKPVTKTETPTLLEGDGLRLTLKEGIFGRTTGVYPEFAGQIYVSGRHGELRCMGGQWQIRDLGSHNGTFLNGVRLQPDVWTDLHVGDKLKIATTHLTVR